MDEQHLEQMVRRLKPAIRDPPKARAILKRYWQDKMALVWNVEQVFKAANERGVALTKWEAIKLLQQLHTHHNPQSGIKWEDLTSQIEGQVLGRKLTKSELKRFVGRDLITFQK